ncbi:MAG: leucine--tRNA ligase [Clostridiales Family XIII bacterium]|jgi:leucyl-tRNA synthetase|nr:leucine--tRNA ligase [Clostridiales Family XIII bacterium]
MDIDDMTSGIKNVKPRWDVQAVEAKWQRIWDERGAFRAVDFSSKPKFYVLSEFFGPSGKGIHLGHVKCFTPTEIVARYMRFKGYNVLYPVGWDAFGLPTENYALKTGRQPDEVTRDNIAIFTRQLRRMGFSFDWSREISTADPGYYRWTQWIFLKLLEKGLAYKTKGEVNFCPSCQTVLSNEDSQGGICDRCHSPVAKATRDVWYLRMRDYSEKILEAVEAIDMKDGYKEAQRNWVGRSAGAVAEFGIEGSEESIRVFTTRPDTIYGATFMVLAPEHGLVAKLMDRIANRDEVLEYQRLAAGKSGIEKQESADKTGVALEGVSAINPVNGARLPVFIADYVLASYGFGAVMAVPAHDGRDFDFAKKYGLPIIEVISGGDVAHEAYEGDGTLVNSGMLNGMRTAAAKEAMTEHLRKMGRGEARINYRMQDWPFNRQRYWGEPFPIVSCPKCGHVPLDEALLPLVLPKTGDFSPDPQGNGPLSKLTDWIRCACPVCGGPAKRESDTMPNWAGSSWYWLRFLDPENSESFVSREKLEYWGAVDLYTGGTEHVTRHMLYAFFWHSFLFDMGAAPHKLPFSRRMCNGLILDEAGRKMSKSSENAIDPVLVIDRFGADVFRLHMMFIGEYEQNTAWTFKGITGITGFLNRVFDMQGMIEGDGVSPKHESLLHRLVKKADTGIYDIGGGKKEHNDFKFNTIIASMMEFANEIRGDGYITKEEYRQFLIVLNVFAPHLTSEIYEAVFGGDIMDQAFPSYDEGKLVGSSVEIPVQLNGRLKALISVERDEGQDSVERKALAALGIDGPADKAIYVKNKIINIIKR